MGGLAHYIEAEGIPTVIISLVREHTDRMKPPRGLAVPFELGRPFGAANEPEFQRRVLLHALKLLERTDGPILDDFPDTAPGTSQDLEGWTCPVNLAPPKTDLSDRERFALDLKQEISLLRPWYEESVRNQNGRRMNGLTEFDPNEIVDFLTQFLETPDMDSIIEGIHVGRAVKLTSDDLKYFYYQAALARPSAVTDTQIGSWFYGETLAGKLFLRLKQVMAAQDDEVHKAIARTNLVPHHQTHQTLD